MYTCINLNTTGFSCFGNFDVREVLDVSSCTFSETALALCDIPCVSLLGFVMLDLFYD